MSLFEIKNCKKSFDGVPVIKDISFKVNEGEVVAEIQFENGGKKKFLPKFQRKSLDIIK